jgi:hypothetical protein
MNTHFFADTIGHLASVAQKIEADYVYNLVVGKRNRLLSFLVHDNSPSCRGFLLLLHNLAVVVHHLYQYHTI